MGKSNEFIIYGKIIKDKYLREDQGRRLFKGGLRDVNILARIKVRSRELSIVTRIKGK